MSSSGAQTGLHFQTSACEAALCCASFLSGVFVLHLILIMVILSKPQCLSSASAATWRTHSKLLGNGYHGATANRKERVLLSSKTLRMIREVREQGYVWGCAEVLTVPSSERQLMTQKCTMDNLLFQTLCCHLEPQILLVEKGLNIIHYKTLIYITGEKKPQSVIFSCR